MEKIIYIIKIWALIQLIIIITLILLFNITQIFLRFKIKLRHKKINKINNLLSIIANDPTALTSSMINFFNQSILEFISCFDNANQINQENPNWHGIKNIISNNVLKYQIKSLASSRYWFKRYLATRCYELGVNIEDEETLLKLIKDDVLLISINAAMLIFNMPSLKSINELIDVFSKERRMLKLEVVNIITSLSIKNDYFIMDILIKRLYEEKNIHAKILCYQILGRLKSSNKIDPIAEKDLSSSNPDLKIAVLIYIAHADIVMCKSILIRFLNDPNDEVRAVVAKLLGKTEDQSAIPYLKLKLSDKAWWVRINSANALANLGQTGMTALMSLSPHEDKFAYETAQAYLKIYKNNMEGK